VNARESVKGKIIDRYSLKLFLDMAPSSFADNIFRGVAWYASIPPLSRVRPRSWASRGAKAHFQNQQLGIDPSYMYVGDEKRVKHDCVRQQSSSQDWLLLDPPGI